MRRSVSPATVSSHAAEYWKAESSHDSVLVLNVPGLVTRARVFDIDISLLVSVPAEAHGPIWHELVVEFDGVRQWARRVPSQNPGQTDGLDFHQHLRLDVDQALRIRATANLRGVQLRQLLIEAREESV